MSGKEFHLIKELTYSRLTAICTLEPPFFAYLLLLFLLSLLKCENLAIMFDSEHVETKKITVKLQKIIKKILSLKQQLTNEISLHNAISIISMASKQKRRLTAL